MDVSSLHQYNSTQEQNVYESSAGNGFWSAEPYYAFRNVFKYETEKLLLDKFTIVEDQGVRESYNWLQCYSLQTIKDELKENGFDVVEHYSNVAGDAYKEDANEIALVCTKNHRLCVYFFVCRFSCIIAMFEVS